MSIGTAISDSVAVIAGIVGLISLAIAQIIRKSKDTHYKAIIAEKELEIERMRQERKDEAVRYDKQVQWLVSRLQDTIKTLNIK